MIGSENSSRLIKPLKAARQTLQRTERYVDQLYESLKGLSTECNREALREGRGKVVKYIFHRNGAPIAQNSIRHIFKRILAKAGLRDIRFHDVRHTFASQLLSNGQSPVYVKEQLGHSSIQFTVDIYGHLIPNSNRGAVNQLDDIAPKCTLSAPAQKERAATC